MSDLWAALALVLVIEGLFLFVAPGAWRQMAEQIQALPDSVVRRFGAVMVALGLLALYLVRGGDAGP
ncbi:MAG: membrane protein [Lysobacterales bacterium]|jgi:uncharacterized protein YjeT (DUF2065 family)|nr:MAG: membrane protein [Xanthomonadales bacterium]